MSRLRVLGVNLAILLVGVLAIEGVFGSWIRDQRIRNLNLVTDRHYLHDVSSLYDRAERAAYRRDEYGLRGPYESPATIDILTMGGSTTDQKYLSEGETWQDVMRERFARDGLDVSVVNAGVDGHSTLGHLRSFDWWFPAIPQLAPKYVLLFVGVNDVHIESQAEYDAIEGTGEPSLSERIRDNSGLYYAYRTLRGMRRARLRGVGHQRIDFAEVVWVDAPLRERHAERSLKRRLQFAQRLRALAARTREIRAEPIFVTQRMRSSKWRDGVLVGREGEPTNGVDLGIVTGMFNEVTMKVCRAEQAVCVDLATDMQHAFDDGDFYDFIHTTPSGAAKIGEYLHRSLRDRLELGS